MAMRYQFPQGFPDVQVDRTQELKKTYANVPLGKTIEFRTGADLAVVVKQILDRSFSVVEAATGAGKSTRLPLAIAEAANKVVVHVLPNKFMAAALYEWLSQSSQAFAIMNAYDMVMPGSGVVITSSDVMVARYIALGRSFQFPPGAVVVLDEAHESDCFTYTVSNVVASDKADYKVVLTTATVGGANFKVAEVPGQVKVKEYEHEPVLTWDIHDPSKPWHAASIPDSLLVFTDDPAETKYLLTEYGCDGFDIYHLHAGMSMESFMNFYRSYETVRPSLMVVADSTFKTGFTFSRFSRVIDTCRVRYLDVSGDTPRAAYRRAYSFEIYQAKGRCGRLGGVDNIYYRPAYKPEQIRVILEGVETEGAAVLAKACGFLPPRFTFLNAKFFQDLYPKSLVSAFGSSVPLAYLSDDALEPYVKKSDRVTDSYKFNKVDVKRPISPGLKLDNDGVNKRAAAIKGSESEFAKAIYQMVEGCKTDYQAEVGVGLMLHEPDHDRDTSPLFPLGLKSLLRYVARPEWTSVLPAIGPGDRAAAVNAATGRHNDLCVTIKATEHAARSVMGDIDKYTSAVMKNWLVGLSEARSAALTEDGLLVQIINVLSKDWYDVEPFEIPERKYVPLVTAFVARLPAVVKSKEPRFLGSTGVAPGPSLIAGTQSRWQWRMDLENRKWVEPPGYRRIKGPEIDDSDLSSLSSYRSSGDSTSSNKSETDVAGKNKHGFVKLPFIE